MKLDPFERLSAYADGELENDQRLAVEADLASDPALRAMHDYIRSTQSSLRQAYLHTYHADAPDRLLAVLNQPSASGLRARSALTWWRLPLLAGVPVAAIAGIFAGWLAAGSSDTARSGTLMVASAEGLVAGEELARFLDTSVSGSPADLLGVAANIQLSFEADGGDMCRQFQAGQTAALACKGSDGQWQIEASASTQASLEQTYLPAAGGISPAIDAAIAGKGIVQVLDAQGERAQISSSWGG